MKTDTITTKVPSSVNSTQKSPSSIRKWTRFTTLEKVNQRMDNSKVEINKDMNGFEDGHEAEYVEPGDIP